ncbi:ndt80 protein [Lichtheimia corymbifera JMRC:FSU:9682]|uniref:Ndt80 protein n=1 Tax=Lichtheimia corymbifera JMRC:FSU:9682 TaxID=1263082 RepID=A0A068SFL9_9FUNG|nr:ndt80 protein [Lichtheimia corymbifera JMRC:FSU:9682]
MPPNTVSSVKAENTSIYDSSSCERSYMSQQTPPSPTPRTATAGIDAEHRNAYTTPPSDSPPSASSPALSYAKYAASSSSSSTSHHNPPPYATAGNSNYHHHHRHASNNTRTSSSEYSLVDSATTTPATNMMTEPAALSFTRTMYNNNILSLDKSSILQVDLRARIDRGFFLADNDWTCYRRNYFQLSTAFTLQGIGVIYDGQSLPCWVKKQQQQEKKKNNEEEEEQQLHAVERFMVGISSHVANSDKAVELVEYSPKRDKGPTNTPQPRPLTPGGNLTLSSVNGTPAIATFERIQFKSATANNGKRRAAQQYYVVAVNLYAQLNTGELISVASIDSTPVVVRGRSPGHYADGAAAAAAATAVTTTATTGTPTTVQAIVTTAATPTPTASQVPIPAAGNNHSIDHHQHHHPPPPPPPHPQQQACLPHYDYMGVPYAATPQPHPLPPPSYMAFGVHERYHSSPDLPVESAWHRASTGGYPPPHPSYCYDATAQQQQQQQQSPHPRQQHHPSLPPPHQQQAYYHDMWRHMAQQQNMAATTPTTTTADVKKNEMIMKRSLDDSDIDTSRNTRLRSS